MNNKTLTTLITLLTCVLIGAPAHDAVAQFSAAVADTGGAGGLASDLSRGRMSPRTGYAVLAVVGVALTWVADIFDIIAYASRAFALYYALQALIAALGARQTPAKAAWFGCLALLALAITLFGAPVEGG